MKSTDHILQYLKKLGFASDAEILRSSLRQLAELLMELEVSAIIDAGHYERNENRVAYRNGYRQRTWRTSMGNIRLNIPKLRSGTYTPDFLTRSTAEVMHHVLQKVMLLGVTQDDVKHLLHDLSILEGDITSFEQIHSTLCDLSDQLHQQTIASDFPCMWLDVVDFELETPQRTQHKQMAIAVGIRANTDYQVLGFQITSDVNHADFWRMFLRDLTERGLQNVRLVVSDAYHGVKSAIYEELTDAEWQYSRARAIQEVLRHVPEHEHSSITAAISTVFVQSDRQSASAQLGHVIDSLSGHWMQPAHFLSSISENLLAYTLLSPEQFVMLEVVNTLARIRQSILGTDNTDGEMVDAVSRQMITDEQISSIESFPVMPLPMMTIR